MGRNDSDALHTHRSVMTSAHILAIDLHYAVRLVEVDLHKRVSMQIDTVSQIGSSRFY